MTVAALLGAASGAALIAWPPEVTPAMFSYPLGDASHLVFQAFFAVQQVGLLLGLLALTRLVSPGSTRPTRYGLVTAGVGMVLLVVMEVVELVVVAAIEVRTDSGAAAVIGTFFGVASVLIGAGLVVAGAGLARRRAFPGWARWIVLACGVWVFVPMTPALGGPMVVGRLVIAGWMLLFAALGVALTRAGRVGLE